MEGAASLTGRGEEFHTLPMRPRPVIRLLALVLALLTGALTSGVPSHHHGDGDLRHVVSDAGHHGHGVQIVDQAERLASQGSAATLPSESTLDLDEDLPVTAQRSITRSQPTPRSLPPPSDQPRAPPVSV